MQYKFKAINKYLDDLAAKLPAPGGGSAAALAGAMGASLLSMVANFTVGKSRYAVHEVAVRDVRENTEKLRMEFLNLCDLDVAAYGSGNLRDALDVPFMTARLCYEAIKFCPVLLKKGNPNLVTDVGVAVIFFEAAFSSAVLNVEINLKALGDEKLAGAMRKELNKKLARIKKIRAETEAKVGEIIRG